MAIDLSWIAPARAALAAKRQQLDEVEAAIEKAERALGATAFAPVPAPGPAPRVAPARPPAKPGSALRPAMDAPPLRAKHAAAPPPAPGADIDVKVLAFFARQSAPMHLGAAKQKLGLGAHVFRGAVERLLHAKQLVRRGVTRGLRVGTPDVMAAADQEGD